MDDSAEISLGQQQQKTFENLIKFMNEIKIQLQVGKLLFYVTRISSKFHTTTVPL